MAVTPDITVVVTAHSEGREVARSLNALRSTIAAVPNLAVEVVLVLDGADEATEQAVGAAIARDAVAGAVGLEVLRVEHRDLSAARNDGIRGSRARFVGVLDADNLPSPNWLAGAYATLKAGPTPAIAHPELIVTFGERREVWPLMASSDPRFESGWLAWYNPWDAFVLAHREVLEEIPYRASRPGDGFGPEDWAFNCDTLAAGIPHLIARGTTLYYRMDAGGLAGAHGSSLLPRTSFLRDRERASEVLRRLDAHVADAPSERRPRPRALRIATRVARPVRQTATRAARAVADRLLPGDSWRAMAGETAVPAHLLDRRDEWAGMHLLQPDLPYPSDEVLRSYREWGTTWGREFLPEQRAYWSAVATLPPRIDVVFVAPWVRTGGADLLTLQHIAAVQRLRPRASIALITTEPVVSTDLDGLDGVSIFDLGEFRLLPQFGVKVLGSLLAQLRPGAVHVINSTLGFDVLDRYGKALSAHSNLFASTYVVDRLPDGTEWSFLYHRSRDFYRYITRVLTDNQPFVRRMIEFEGAPADTFVVHGAPTAVRTVDRAARSGVDGERLRVVWAGRFDRQKRLDRVPLIAAALSRHDVVFEVYGAPVIGDDPGLESTIAQLSAMGIAVRPPFRGGFDAIADAHVLLVTSDWEGVPNIVLEALGSGMSVVAPDVGGVRHVITDETGWLIADPADIANYVEALESIATDPAIAHKRAVAGQRLIAEKYSQSAFDAVVEALPGYLPLRDSNGTPRLQFFTDPATESALDAGGGRIMIYTGSNGHSNFGDILQTKNIAHYWRQRTGVEPVVFLPLSSISDPSRAARLRAWLRCDRLVFFGPGRVSAPTGLGPLGARSTGGLLHVVGGGYLNRLWGEQHSAAIDGIAASFGVSAIVGTGLQIDESAVPQLDLIARRHHVAALGFRDNRSLQIASRLPVRTISTFDDATEVFEEWVRAVPPRVARRGRVVLHLNTSTYAGGEATWLWRQVLARVAAERPDEVYLLHAYADHRREVQDTLDTVASLAEDFPFPTVRVINTARVALDWEPGSGLPDELSPLLEASYAISSSYHTALMMTFFGVPTYVVAANAYFEQKKGVFSNPSLHDFLAAPRSYIANLAPHRAIRRGWTAELDAWSLDGAEPWRSSVDLA